MSEEQEKQWREEFRIFFFKGSEFWHNSNTAISIEKYSEPYKHGVQGYIEARKKAQEEIDEMTKDRDRIHAHRAKLIEEITQLKEELKSERFFSSKFELQAMRGFPTGKEWYYLVKEHLKIQKQRKVKL